MESGTIFDFITSQVTKYSKPVEIEEGWFWNMRDHLKRSFLYLNSQFYDDNENRDLRPFKNIVLPILNIQFRTEGFDVKDIDLYVDNPDEYFKSLLVKKYHQVWALQVMLDSFIDEMVESYGTYGGALVRKTKSAKPEVVDLRTLAFANQNDILSNPFGILHEMSFSELRDKADTYGWGEDGSDIDIEGIIQLAKKEGKDCVRVYEVHGNMPIEWLKDEDIVGISKKDVGQIQVVAEYRNQDGKKAGVTLFRKLMPKLPFKFIKRDEVKNRALGRGGVEELFEAQTWTNWDEVKIREMLDSASKTIHWSDDPSFKSRNNLNNVGNNEVLSLMEGRQIQQLNTYPRNLQVFNESVDRFWQHAQILGSAPEALMGEAPNSGTPFKLYEAQQIEGKGTHKYRQGKLAVFMDELYREWILPYFQTEIVKEQTFMEELSADELAWVVDKVMTQKSNEFKKRMIMGLQDIDDDIVSLYAEKVKEDVMKQGSKRFFKIFKDEMKDLPIKVMTNIAGKQKNLALMTDKLVNVLREIVRNPSIRQDPEAIKLFNQILESSGLNPMNIVAQAAPVMPQQVAGMAQGGMMPQGEGQMNA